MIVEEERRARFEKISERLEAAALVVGHPRYRCLVLYARTRGRTRRLRQRSRASDGHLHAKPGKLPFTGRFQVTPTDTYTCMTAIREFPRGPSGRSEANASNRTEKAFVHGGGQWAASCNACRRVVVACLRQSEALQLEAPNTDRRKHALGAIKATCNETNTASQIRSNKVPLQLFSSSTRASAPRALLPLQYLSRRFGAS